MNLSRVYFIFLMLMLYGLVYCDEVKGEKKNADASVQKKNSTEEKKEAGKLPIETSLNKPDAALEAKNTKPKSQELVDGKDKSKNPPEDKANSNQTAPQKPEEKVPNPNEKVLKSNETGPNLNETGPNLNATGPKIEQNKTDQKPEEKTAQATDTKKEPEKPKNEKNQEINKETGDEDENENEEEKNLDDKNNQEENDQEEKEGDKEQPAKEKGKDASTEKNVQTKKGAVGAGVVGEDDDSSTHVMTFFIVLVILLAVCYLAMHNKKKILGLLIEGRSTKARRNVRYRRLSTNDDHESGTTIY